MTNQEKKDYLSQAYRLDRHIESLIAENVLNQAICYSESINKGLSVAYSNKADWLSKILYLAKKQLESEEK